MKSLITALLCAVGVLTTAPALTAEIKYPTRPITIVVPFPPGGSFDILARLIDEKFQERFGQSLIVDHRPGASGTIGAARVARAEPDGYTLMMTPNTFVLAPLILPKSVVSYDVEKDFVPVILPTKTMLVLAAHPSLGVSNVKELVAYAQKHPDITYTGAPNGSPQQIAGEMLKKSAGFDMRFVPYKGMAPALVDTVGGHVNLVFATYTATEQHLQSGALVALGSLDKDPLPNVSDVKPISQQGYPDVVVNVWTSLFAPAGTPRYVVDTLNKEINDILNLPDVQKRLESMGQILVGGSPQVLAEQVKRDTAVYSDIVRSAKISVE